KSRQVAGPDSQAVITENISENLALQDNLEYLRRALIRQGFESVWVTENNGVLSVGFENTLFNRNEIDALGVAMGLAAQVSPSSINFLDITLSKYGVKTLRFRLSLLRLKEFYANNAQLPPLQSLMASDTNAISQAKISNSGSYLIPRVILTPKVRHFMGTELGMLDYSIALRSTVELPIWSGGVLYGDYDYQLTQTEDFERGKSFYRWSLPSRWSNFAFKQMLQMPLNIYTSVGLGRFKGSYNEEYDGIFAETFWQSPSGAHSVSYSGGYYDSRIYNNERQMGVGRYRYYWQALDLSISYEAGQYWRQDKGSKLEFAFNFGDTKAHFYLQDTDHQLLGFGFSMPLAARKDRSPSRGQLRATNAFYVSTSTMINSDSGCNCLVPGRAQLAPYSSEIASQYFNNDRLNINYIHANQQRLREAFFDFVKQ
ncbi:MAG: YjbH domain-containing protein, partial [Porticoccaceae bacterium]